MKLGENQQGSQVGWVEAVEGEVRPFGVLPGASRPVKLRKGEPDLRVTGRQGGGALEVTDSPLVLSEPTVDHA